MTRFKYPSLSHAAVPGAAVSVCRSRRVFIVRVASCCSTSEHQLCITERLNSLLAVRGSNVQANLSDTNMHGANICVCSPPPLLLQMLHTGSCVIATVSAAL